MEAFELGAVRVELDALAVHRPTETLSLTPTEADLVRRLLQADGEPVPKDVLLQEVWGYSGKVRSRTVDTTIHRLRAKLELDPGHPQHLITHRGRGIALGSVTRMAAPVARVESRPLVGRSELIVEIAGLAGPGRLLALTGPVGAGLTSLALAVAGHEGARVVQLALAGVRDEAEIWSAIVAQAPAPLPATLEGVLSFLRHEPVGLVLDDLAPGVLHADGLKQLVEVATVFTTVPQGVPFEQVVPVPPLSEDAATSLVQSELDRLGHGALEPGLLGELLVRTDRLPGALVLLAPLVGLFGSFALETLAESMETPLERALGLIDPERRALLDELAVFEGAFDAEAAAAVVSVGRLETLAGLRLLVQRGLLLRRGTTFRLLRALRAHLLSRGAGQGPVRERWLRFLVGLENQDLLDGGRLVQRHQEDLARAAEEVAEPRDAEAIGTALADLLMTQWVRGRGLRAVQTLLTRFDLPRLRLAEIGIRFLAEIALTSADSRILVEAAPDSLLASWLLQQQGTVQALTAEELLSRPSSEADRARFLPYILARLPSGDASPYLPELLRLADAHGWRAVERHVQEVSVASALFHGDFEAVLRGADALEPDDPLAADLHLATAVAAMALGEHDTARRELELAARCRPIYALRAELVRALVNGLDGVDPRPSLERLQQSPLRDRDRELARVAAALYAGTPLPRLSRRVRKVVEGELAPVHQASLGLVALAVFARRYPRTR